MFSVVYFVLPSSTDKHILKISWYSFRSEQTLESAIWSISSSCKVFQQNTNLWHMRVCPLIFSSTSSHIPARKWGFSYSSDLMLQITYSRLKTAYLQFHFMWESLFLYSTLSLSEGLFYFYLFSPRAWMKNKSVICLNPRAKWTQKLMRMSRWVRHIKGL